MVVAIFEHLDEVAFLGVLHRCAEKIVKHEHIEAREAPEFGDVGAVGSSDRE